MKKQNINIKEVKAKILNLEPLTSEEKKAFITYAFCTNHTGKMVNMVSISTSCLNNPYCEARRKNKKLVCYECYAAAQLEYQNTTRDKNCYTFVFFNNYELTKEDVPAINASIFRVEAFGDTASVLCCKNYYTIARANKRTTFGVWSKNVDLYALAGIKPKNVVFVYSIPEVDNVEAITPAYFDMIKKYYPFVDKIFVVFTKGCIAKHNIKVNCGGRNCIECTRCYHKNKGYRDNIIIEQKK